MTLVFAHVDGAQQALPLYAETFGSPTNPAILLNAGAGDQLIQWPETFCETLAEHGYFVIRYDYRDTGKSPATPASESSYTVADLARDACDLLDAYHIRSAHIIGFSMGGQLGQILDAQAPERVLSLVLIGTSSDFRPGFNAFDGVKDPSETLSPPLPSYIQFMTSQTSQDLQKKDPVAQYVQKWYWLDGKHPDYDIAFYRQQGQAFYQRSTQHASYLAHAHAMRASFEMNDQALSKITAPTLILHGEKDPVFPVDHGRAMHKGIPGSQLVILKDMGHALSPRVVPRLVHAIHRFIQNIDKRSD